MADSFEAEVDWDVFFEHLRREGDEAAIAEYPQYEAWVAKQRQPSPVAAARTATIPLNSTSPDLPDQAAVHVIERIIERQVLVMRCQYCRELTPVDVDECRTCGAKM